MDISSVTYVLTRGRSRNRWVIEMNQESTKSNRNAIAKVAGDPQLGSQNLIVLISGVFHSVYTELLPVFEKQSGISVESYLSPSMGHSPDSVCSRLDRGEPADVLIMAGEGLDDIIQRGIAVRDTRIELALSPVGIAVKKGSPKPDISTPEKLKQMLLTAKSVAYSISASGQYVSGELFKTLGIAEEMKGKTHEVQGTTPVAKTIADGTYQIGFQAVSELGAVAGVEIVGALPDAVALVNPVGAAIAAKSRNPHEGATLLRFLSRSAVGSTLKKHGLEPPRK